MHRLRCAPFRLGTAAMWNRLGDSRPVPPLVGREQRGGGGEEQEARQGKARYGTGWLPLPQQQQVTVTHSSVVSSTNSFPLFFSFMFPIPLPSVSLFPPYSHRFFPPKRFPRGDPKIYWLGGVRQPLHTLRAVFPFAAAIACLFPAATPQKDQDLRTANTAPRRTAICPAFALPQRTSSLFPDGTRPTATACRLPIQSAFARAAGFERPIS